MLRWCTEETCSCPINLPAKVSCAAASPSPSARSHCRRGVYPHALSTRYPAHACLAPPPRCWQRVWPDRVPHFPPHRHDAPPPLRQRERAAFLAFLPSAVMHVYVWPVRAALSCAASAQRRRQRVCAPRSTHARRRRTSVPRNGRAPVHRVCILPLCFVPPPDRTQRAPRAVWTIWRAEPDTHVDSGRGGHLTQPSARVCARTNVCAAVTSAARVPVPPLPSHYFESHSSARALAPHMCFCVWVSVCLGHG